MKRASATASTSAPATWSERRVREMYCHAINIHVHGIPLLWACALSHTNQCTNIDNNRGKKKPTHSQFFFAGCHNKILKNTLRVVVFLLLLYCLLFCLQNGMQRWKKGELVPATKPIFVWWIKTKCKLFMHRSRATQTNGQAIRRLSACSRYDERERTATNDGRTSLVPCYHVHFSYMCINIYAWLKADGVNEFNIKYCFCSWLFSRRHRPSFLWLFFSPILNVVYFSVADHACILDSFG